MIWLLSEFWIVGVVSLVSGFVVTWLSIVRRINLPAHDEGAFDVSAEARGGEGATAVPQGEDGAIGFDLSRRSAAATERINSGESGPAFEWMGDSRD